YWRVENYYRDKGTLPESLAACDISPATFVQQKRDRVTGEPYVYRVVDATHFEVGATFALPSAPDEGRWQRYGKIHFGPGEEAFWKHGAGRQTFRIDVAGKRR
ncbi:MAG: hypothetical protein N2689_17255, partial [Verrucomicrobiae bacterium]|nr:hypothetical protein [Verrucomicrobiae bacterium]